MEHREMTDQYELVDGLRFRLTQIGFLETVNWFHTVGTAIYGAFYHLFRICGRRSFFCGNEKILPM